MKTSLLILSLAIAVSAVPAHAEEITLDAPSTVISSFDVAVNVTDVFAAPHDFDDLVAYGFDVSFDSTAVSYLGETSGPLFTDLSSNPGIGADVAGIATEVFLEAGDFTEPLTLAVLHFQAIGSGPTSISITGDSSNPDQGLFYLSGSDPISASTLVDISPVSAPEPGTLLLCLFGLAALFATCSSRFSRRSSAIVRA
jgi:hypothetical protein